MEVTLSPELKAELDRLVNETGRSASQFIEDALAGYFDEFQPLRETIDSRYDDLELGRVKAIPGEDVVAYFEAKSAALRAKQF